MGEPPVTYAVAGHVRNSLPSGARMSRGIRLLVALRGILWPLIGRHRRADRDAYGLGGGCWVRTNVGWADGFYR
jgi:hypothetical protein